MMMIIMRGEIKVGIAKKKREKNDDDNERREKSRHSKEREGEE